MATRVREMQIEGREEAARRDDESYPVLSRWGVIGWINPDGAFITARAFRHGRGRLLGHLCTKYPNKVVRRNTVTWLRHYNRWTSPLPKG